MKPRTGINGFGRIGRLVTRAALMLDNIEITAINDPSLSPEMIAYLLQYDSVHGPLGREVTYDESSVSVGSSRIRCYSTREPSEVPWAESGADYVVEATGVFLTREKALAHKAGGARYIIMSAPPKDDTPMFVMGVNHESYRGQDIVSNASCTTNCLAPLARIVHENYGIVKGLMTTVHAATATQATVDSASRKDPRSGRAAFSNIIPSSTGAAKAVGRVLPALAGKLTGMAFRVPVADVSVVDLTVMLERPTSYAELCATVRRAAEGPMGQYIGYTDRPMVSSDFIGDPHGGIFDATAGLAIDETFMKLVAWYDNEYGYSANVTRLIAHMAEVNGNA